jgi:hypothetical protein
MYLVHWNPGMNSTVDDIGTVAFGQAVAVAVYNTSLIF